MLDFLQNLRLQTLYNPSFWNSMSNNGMPQGSTSIPNMEPTFPMDMGPQNVDPGMSAPPPNPNPMGGGDDKIGNWLAQLYTPEHQQSDRLDTMLNTYPNRESPEFQHKGVGGFLTKLAAIAGGMQQGPGMYSEVMDHKFNDKLKDWQTQIGPVERAATLEKQTNTNERTMAMQTIANRLRDEAQQHKEQNDAVNAQIRQQRADVYEFKAKNPGMKLVITKGGNVQAMDPITGEMHDTGIPSGSLTDADKAALTHDYTSKEITQRGEETRKTQDVKHEDTMEEIGARGEQARTTKSTPSGTGNNPRPELPSQTRVRQFNKARELYNSRPDLRPFIKINGTNDFQITAPGKSFLGNPQGPTPQQYKEINDAIYGDMGGMAPVSSHGPSNTPVLPSPGQGNKGTVNTPQSPVAPKAPAGWKYVPKPGGGWTAVPDPTNKG